MVDALDSKSSSARSVRSSRTRGTIHLLSSAARSVVMLLSARFHIPEVITGVVGAVFIGLSLYGSARYNRRHPSDPGFGTLDDCSPVRPDGSELKS